MFSKSQDNVFTMKAQKLMAILLTLSFSLALFGCRKVNSSFPSVEVTSTETTETTTVTTETKHFTHTISIASPLSYETCVYIAKLYALKNSGQLAEGVSGENITLDYLDSIDLPFALNVYSTAETGCNADTLRQWQESGSLPDIFLTDSFDEVVQAGYAIPVTRYLSDETLLTPGNIYPKMLEQLYLNNEYYGIPYQASAYLMYADMEVLNRAGIQEISFKQDLNSFGAILDTLSGLNAEAMEILPFYLAQGLIPYLPISLYGDTYRSVRDGKTLSSKSWKDSLEYLKTVVASGKAYESLDTETVSTFFQGMSPLLSRKVGIWAGSSDEVSRYDNYMPNTLVMMQIPSTDKENYSPAMLSVYPLCISSSCDQPAETVKFASFMALDEDALLLASRLDLKEGFLPVVSSSTVWKNMVSTQKYGSFLSPFQSLMQDAVYIPAVTEKQEYEADLQYIATHLDSLIVEKITEETE
ncbi:MAG: extracellular solute-binding protein [Lachnospiraceae bacterium]|nr:extracellular solute-binding protein [Clostridiales bacterium]MBR6851615.1 extracellular solute-binding protein [Lachnospiraceae bacterium]